MNINSTADILKYIYELDKQNSSFRFRGQANYNWTLEPTIYRFNSLKRYQTVEYERNVMLFRPPNSNPPLTFTSYEIEWLMLCQHYGVPTRLLDWSTDVLTSLFFACNSEDDKTEDGAFFICDYNDYPIFSDYDCKINQYQELSFVNTSIINPRLRAQSGCFMLWGHAPLDRNKTTDGYDLWEYKKANKRDLFLKKLRIPYKSKPKVLNELKEIFSISENNLFLNNSFLFKKFGKNFSELKENARLMTLYKTDAERLTSKEEKKARSFFKVDCKNMLKNTDNLSY